MRLLVSSIAAASLLFGCGGTSSEAPPSTITEQDAIVTPPTDEGVALDTRSPADTSATPVEDTAAALADTTTPIADTGGGIGPYPSGPYGTGVGNTLADLTMEGYLEIGGSYGTVKLSDVRVSSKRKWALIHVSGFT